MLPSTIRRSESYAAFEELALRALRASKADSMAAQQEWEPISFTPTRLTMRLLRTTLPLTASSVAPLRDQVRLERITVARLALDGLPVMTFELPRIALGHVVGDQRRVAAIEKTALTMVA